MYKSQSTNLENYFHCVLKVIHTTLCIDPKPLFLHEIVTLYLLEDNFTEEIFYKYFSNGASVFFFVKISFYCRFIASRAILRHVLLELGTRGQHLLTTG